jgi:enamidase
VGSLLIRNLGRIVTGDLEHPFRDGDTLYAEEGTIVAVGGPERAADVVVDARGLTAIPGLIDGHVHPVFGEYSPVQESVRWVSAYLHCGVTTLVSAGELHVPGLPLNPPDPKTFKYLAVLARRCSAVRPAGAKMLAGTLMVAPGLVEEDFDEIHAEGIRLVKFIFYPYSDDLSEAQQYSRWCRERGIKVKIHSGGVSRSGVSRPAGFDVVSGIGVDVVGHATGGPIPMPEDELVRVLDETDSYLEIATAGNYRLTLRLVELARERNALDRLCLGTDTPSGTGVLPRAMLRNLNLLCSVGGLTPEEAIAIATGNTADAHGLEQGRLEEGRPADVVLMGRIKASVAEDGLDALRIGDLPGVSMVFVDGEPLVTYSDQTPPPETAAVLEQGA